MGPDRRSALLSEVAGGFSQARVAFVVLALGVAVSLVAWRLAEQRVAADAAREFDKQVAQIVDTLDRRVQDVIHLLIGLRGFFAASNEVTREEFSSYLSGFFPHHEYSVVRLVSYAHRVLRHEKAAFETRVRRDTSIDPRGYPGFRIRPPGERAEYLAVEYIHPMKGNEAGLGLDLSFDEVRRRDIARARDSGEPVASGPFEATMEPGRISFAIRMAVYRRGMPTATAEQRREAFQGVIAVLIHAGEFMRSVLSARLAGDLAVVAHDVGAATAATAPPGAGGEAALLFDARADATARAEPPAGGLQRTVMMKVAGREWRLAFSSPGGAFGIEQALLPRVVLAGGLVTSLLLFWLVWALSMSRARALKLAEQARAVRAAEGLREQLAFIQQLIEAVPQPIFFKDAAERRYLGVNQAWEKFFGIPRGQFIGKTVFDLYPHDPETARMHDAKDEGLLRKPGSQSYEAAIVAADGKVHHTIYNKATFSRPDGAIGGLIGVITDVTGLKEAEAALRESEARFRDLTELSSDWYWEQDGDFRFTQISSKFEEFDMDAAAQIGKTLWELPVSGVSEEQWDAHRRQLEAHEPFRDFVYQRRDRGGELRTVSVSGRPIFDEQGHFRGYRGTGHDVTEQRRVEERIRHMAHHDALTGLPNRMLVQDRIGQAIAQAQRSRRGLALLFVDLDRFKSVNDSLGHHVGDELLRAVAERLGSCVRTTDTVSRIGGDEFVVVLTDLAHVEDARHVAQKILDAFAKPFVLRGNELHATPSVGICVYPQDGEDADTLMRNADAAMYHAKESGRNNFQFFTPEMNVRTHERLAIERDLRRALERGELGLHYQPQIDLRTGAIVGFEALARWHHPGRGMVPPSDFIRVAEEAGLINPLGEFVLREACNQARSWQAAGYPALQVAVNCSAHQFRREGMVEAVARLLKEAGLAPECLELEITESVLIQHADQVTEWFWQLNEMGLQLSIDDFGTGYSSLSYLKRFPIRKLKIDQSFVRDIGRDADDGAIVSAIVAMAHSLGMEVIAEGVETAEQLAFLRSLGCDRAQGYYFSKPLPAAEFLALLRTWNPEEHAARR